MGANKDRTFDFFLFYALDSHIMQTMYEQMQIKIFESK